MHVRKEWLWNQSVCLNICNKMDAGSAPILLVSEFGARSFQFILMISGLVGCIKHPHRFLFLAHEMESREIKKGWHWKEKHCAYSFCLFSLRNIKKGVNFPSFSESGANTAFIHTSLDIFIKRLVKGESDSSTVFISRNML